MENLKDFGKRILNARKDFELKSSEDGKIIVSIKDLPKKEKKEYVEKIKKEVSNKNPFFVAFFHLNVIKRIFKKVKVLKEEDAIKKMDEMKKLRNELLDFLMKSMFDIENIDEKTFEKSMEFIGKIIKDTNNVNNVIFEINNTAQNLSFMKKVYQDSRATILNTNWCDFTLEERTRIACDNEVLLIKYPNEFAREKMISSRKIKENNPTLIVDFPVKQVWGNKGRYNYDKAYKSHIKILSGKFEDTQSFCVIVRAASKMYQFKTLEIAQKFADDLKEAIYKDVEEVEKEKIKKPNFKKKNKLPRWEPSEIMLERKNLPIYFKENVKKEDYLKVFDVYGVQYGNYVGFKLRQSQTNYTFNGLCDLAQVLNVSTKDLFYHNDKLIPNAHLGLSFGARGRGGNAIAHFEPVYQVINFTKKKGYSALAHEWAHSLDNFFAKLFNLDKLFLTDLNPICARKYIEASPLKKCEKSFIEILNILYKYSEYKKISYTFGANYAGGIKYWASETEMWARAFEAYIIDKMKEQNLTSTFLISEHANYPYPKGEEREIINACFDNIFETLKEQKIFSQFEGVEKIKSQMFSWETIPMSKEDFAKLDTTNTVQISFFN